jgi:hypothetical protein
MYLFGRRAQLSGAKFRKSAEWVAEITNRVSQTTGLQVGVWNQVFSPAVGTILWTTMVPDLATLEGATDKLAVDEHYADLVEKGQDYTMPGIVDDVLGVIIRGEPDPNRRNEYVISVRTTILGGKIATGMALGVEIAERVEAITGSPTLFMADATGNYGGVGWATGFANIGDLERAQMAVNGDAKFIELIDDKAKGVYNDTPGEATQVIYRRIPV